MRDREPPVAAEPLRSNVEPLWVRATLRFLPVPIYAFLVAVTFLAVACFFYLLGKSDKETWALVIAGSCALMSLLIGSANAVRWFGRDRDLPSSPRYEPASTAPTLAIIVLLVWIYLWMLIIWLSIYAILFVTGPNASIKFYVSLAIALACSIYLSGHGRSILVASFGARGGRNLIITPGQAVAVVLLVLAVGCYSAWLMFG